MLYSLTLQSISHRLKIDPLREVSGLGLYTFWSSESDWNYAGFFLSNWTLNIVFGWDRWSVFQVLEFNITVQYLFQCRLWTGNKHPFVICNMLVSVCTCIAKHNVIVSKKPFGLASLCRTTIKNFIANTLHKEKYCKQCLHYLISYLPTH